MMRLIALLSVLVAFEARAAALTTPAIAGVVKAGTPIEIIGESFEGTEGPLGLADGSLLFTENRAGRVSRVAPDGTVSAFLSNPAGPNALAVNAAGDIVATLITQPAVAVIHPAEHAVELVEQVDGKSLNRPNDLVAGRKGGVYFTDPGGLRKPGEAAPVSSIYYISPRNELHVIDRSVELPNGIQLSPDEKILYVANTRGEHVLAYDVTTEGVVANRRDFAAAAGVDGLAVDAEGRLYVASSAGVQVFDSKGAALGVIELPKRPQNLAFAGKKKRDLFVVGQGTVYRIHTRTHGILSRAK